MAVVAPEREDGVGRLLVGHGDPVVGAQPLNDVLRGALVLQRQREPDRVHVLGVDLERRAEEVEVVAQRLEEVPGVAGVVRAELLVLVAADFRRGDVRAVLRDVVGAADADEPPVDEVRRAAVGERDGVHEDRHVVRVAGDDLQELVGVAVERGVVDPARVRLAEAELRPLGDEAEGVVLEAFVVVDLVLGADAGGGAIDDDRRAVESLVRFELGMEADLAEGVEGLGIGDEARAAADEVRDLGAVGQQRGALVERDFVDSELVLERDEKADERFADGAGAYDVHDLLAHMSISSL